MCREAILERLRAARANVTVPRAEAPAPAPFVRQSQRGVRPAFPSRGGGGRRGMLGRADLKRTSVPACSRWSTAPRLLSWDPSELPYGLGGLVNGAIFGRAARAEQARAEIGLTGCDAAIAETGSLAMISAPGRSRAVSLLPPFHIAIVSPAHV